MRLSGENLYSQNVLKYENLPSFFKIYLFFFIKKIIKVEQNRFEVETYRTFTNKYNFTGGYSCTLFLA